MPRLSPAMAARARRTPGLLVLVFALTLAVGLPSTARAAAYGWLKVTSLTAGAKVQVDGRTVGHLPLKKAIRLRAGRHKLKVTKPGFMEVEERVLIRAGKRTSRSVMLLAFAGVLTVRSTPTGAEVRVGQELLGKTPLKQAELVVGEQTVKVLLPGHRVWEKTLEVAAGKTYQFRAVLEEDPEAAAAEADPLALVDLGSFDAVDLDPTPAGPAPEADPFAIVDLDEPPVGVADPTASAPVAAVSPTPTAPEPAARPAGPRRPLVKQWWFWTAVGVLATGAIAAGAAGAPPRQVLDCSPVSGVDGHLGLTACGR